MNGRQFLVELTAITFAVAGIACAVFSIGLLRS